MNGISCSTDDPHYSIGPLPMCEAKIVTKFSILLFGDWDPFLGGAGEDGGG